MQPHRRTARVVSFAVSLAVMMIGACDRQESKDLAAIAALRQEHVDAVNSRDADRLLRDMAEDVIYLAPDLPPLVGRAALEAVVRRAYAHIQPRITMAPQRVDVRGDAALEWGCLGGEVELLADGAAMSNDGKYAFVYQRGAAGWEIILDIYNMAPCEDGVRSLPATSRME